MPAVKCAVDGCSTRLQPLMKVDPRDRTTWQYPECDICFRPVCAKHATQIDDRIVCDTCRKEIENRQQPVLIDLGIKPLTKRR